MTGITTINLGGEIRVLSFKNNFLVKLGIVMDADPIACLDKIQEYCATGDVMRALTVIIYSAIIANYEREYNYTHGITIQKIAEWCCDAQDEEFISIWRTFAEIMGVPEASEKQIAEYEEKLKKKVTSPSKQNRKRSPGKASLNTQ